MKTRKTYKLLSQALSRCGVKKPGITSSLLLDSFLTSNGNIKASYVENKGLCKPSGFKKWRKDLIEKGWLSYTIGNYSQHECGPKLIKYINKEKMEIFELATKKEVDILAVNTDRCFSETDKRLKALEIAMKNIINIIDPPHDDEKEKKYLSGGYEKTLKNNFSLN